MKCSPMPVCCQASILMTLSTVCIPEKAFFQYLLLRNDLGPDFCGVIVITLQCPIASWWEPISPHTRASPFNHKNKGPHPGSHFRVTLEAFVCPVCRTTFHRQMNNGEICFHCNQFHWHLYGRLVWGIGSQSVKLKGECNGLRRVFRAKQNKKCNIFFGKGKGLNHGTAGFLYVSFHTVALL